MASEGRLEIVWDGTATGLSERRLSLDAFGPTLARLLPVLQRIATIIERRATDAPAGRGGRYSREADGLDIQLEAISANSPVMVRAVVVQRTEPAQPLFPDLPDRAARAFIDGIKQEIAGQLADASIRKFLRQLPEGLTHQRYTYIDSAGTATEAVVTDMHLPEIPTLGRLERYSGDVIGVDFPPAPPQVRLGDARRRVVVEASSDEVERALALRGASVEALVLHRRTGGKRLLRLHRPDEGPPSTTADEQAAALFARWGPLLERLAR